MFLVNLNKLRRWKFHSELDVRKMKLMRIMANHEHNHFNGNDLETSFSASLKAALIVEMIVQAKTPHDFYDLQEMVEEHLKKYPID